MAETKWPPFCWRQFKMDFPNESVRTLIKKLLKFVPRGPINNIPALVQIMAWCRSGDKPLSEPMMVSLLTHIGVTKPERVQCLNLWLYEICGIYPQRTKLMVIPDVGYIPPRKKKWWWKYHNSWIINKSKLNQLDDSWLNIAGCTNIAVAGVLNPFIPLLC